MPARSIWTSSYTKSYFKGGYSWSETISGYDSESATKRAVYTSNGSSWSWTRSGTVWDDGRNDWSESWSKSSWKDGKYAPSESESKRGGFDPKKTTPQVNDVPKFGEPPRLNKVPKNKPIDLNKRPKPSKGIWTPLRRTPPPNNVPDNWVAGPGGGGGNPPPPNQDKIQKFLREFRRVMALGRQAVIDFLKGFLYHSLINGVGILKDVADLLYPPGAQSHADIEAYYRNNLSFQAGRAIANGLTFLAGILGILLIGLTIGGSGGSALIAAPAQVAALVAAGNMTAASARDIISLVSQVFQANSGNNPWDDVSEEDWNQYVDPKLSYNPNEDLTTLGGRKFSRHAIDDSLQRHGIDPYTGVDAIIDKYTKKIVQTDGATVYIQRNKNGTYNLAIVNEKENRIVTAIVDLQRNQLIRLGQNYGFNPGI